MDRIAVARGACISVRPRELRLVIQHHEATMMTISCSSFIVYRFNLTYPTHCVITIGIPMCGTTKTKTRIVGGVVAKPGAWPWQAILLWTKGPDKGKQFCGASLVDTEWILTAAHCFAITKSKKMFAIRLGKNLKLCYNHQEFLSFRSYIQ